MVDVDTPARALLACVCEALEVDGRPVCTCHATVGPPVIGMCCNCADAGTGMTPESATVHFRSLFPANRDTLEPVRQFSACKKPGFLAADFTIVVTRCYPTLDESGEMPDPAEQDGAATLMHADVDTVFRALRCCADVGRLIVRSVDVDAQPEAGCAVLAARVTVEV